MDILPKIESLSTSMISIYKKSVDGSLSLFVSTSKCEMRRTESEKGANVDEFESEESRAILHTVKISITPLHLTAYSFNRMGVFYLKTHFLHHLTLSLAHH
jgi:hypothetical protein